VRTIRLAGGREASGVAWFPDGSLAVCVGAEMRLFDVTPRGR